MSQHLIYAVEKHWGIITLNRPEALNALTHEMILSLSSQLHAWAVDDEIHAVIIRACEGRAFCAGGDVRGLYELGLQSREAPLQFFKDEYRLNHFIANYPKPYVALLHGFTFGGGVGISLHSPYTIATDDFVFAMPETSIGFFPDIGASYLLSRCPLAYANYLGLTGACLTANEAHALKLIRTIVPRTEFETLMAHLGAIDLTLDAPLKIESFIRQYKAKTEITIDHAQGIESCFNASSVETIMAHLESQNTPWTNEILKQLKQKSPTSLAVTLEQLKRARTYSLEECLNMDYTLAYHFMHHQDFYEGVRALLIDKDKNPRWTDLHDPEHVQRYFHSSQ